MQIMKWAGTQAERRRVVYYFPCKVGPNIVAHCSCCVVIENGAPPVGLVQLAGGVSSRCAGVM